MFPLNMADKRGWYLEDDKSGHTVLRHEYRDGDELSCPRCGKGIKISGNTGQCVSCGDMYQRKDAVVSCSVGRHGRVYGSWASLRPFSVVK